MSDEDSDNASQNLVQNLLGQIDTLADKINKKREHLEEVTEKYHNEAKHLQGLLLKLQGLEASFIEGDKIKSEFLEFSELLSNRCDDVIEKLGKLDTILNEIRSEEDTKASFADRARSLDVESLSTGEGRQECLDLKQEVDDWFDVIRQMFKEAKKRKISLISKCNVEDVSQSLNAWRKASEVAREYSRKFAFLKKDAESMETSMRSEIERMGADVHSLKDTNLTLNSEVSLLKEKLVDAEKVILQSQTMHDEITKDLREKIDALHNDLNEEKRVSFEMEMEADGVKGKLQDLEAREDLYQRKIDMLQERNKLLEGDVESLREKLIVGEKLKEEAETLLFEIQKELDIVDIAKEDSATAEDIADSSRIHHLVQGLKKKLEENQGYIENLESEVKGEKDRNNEKVEEIEKLLHRIEIEEKGKEEQGQLIDTIRNLLDENEKLAADLESQNNSLNEEISVERERVVELRGRVGELQQTISDEKRVNFDMEMAVSKLKSKVEDEESKNELNLKRIELLQQEISSLLDTIKEKVSMNEELRSQIYDYENVKDKLRAERQRNDDNLQSIMELQNKMIKTEQTVEEKEEEIRNIKDELKNTSQKLENVEKELDWIKENNDLLSGILQEKDRSLQEKEERLKQAIANVNSERSVQEEYSLKCTMLEKKIYLTESENKEIIKVAELAEKELQKEREKNSKKDEEVVKLKGQIEEERKKNMESERIIHELEEQLSDADALNQYNQGIKSSSIENIMEAEKQNEQLLNIIEELKENVNEKELGIEELVTRYAVEEQNLRDEVAQLSGQLALSKMDNHTKSEIIKYLKEEIERMRNVMRIKESVLGQGEDGRQITDNVVTKVQQLEQSLEATAAYEDIKGKGETFGSNEELEEYESEVQELLEILQSEKEKNLMYEDMIQRLEEIVKLQDEAKDVDESDVAGAKDTRNELCAKKEDYKYNKRRYMEGEVRRLENLVDDLRERLRSEKKQVHDRDNLISKLNETSKRDFARNEELNAQLQAMKNKAMQQLQHSEEMAKKVEDGQKLIRDLEVQVDKERLRASTIEAVLASQKGRSTDKKDVTKDLKRRVEEYQKTVNDIKGKVDKINRHLHCMSPGSHDSHRFGQPDVSMKRINERLASHSSFIRELKASVGAVEETSKNMRTELRTQSNQNSKQDKKIEDLLSKSTEYDNLVEEMKKELGEIRKRYQELSGELAPAEESDTADGRPESPTKMIRSMPEHELSKQLSHFEELLETIFSEEARRIEELQDKMDEVFKKNIEFSSILCEIRDNLEEDRVKRVPWEVERDELKAALTKSEVKMDHLLATLEKAETAKERLQEKIQFLEEELKEKEMSLIKLQADIHEAEGTIRRLEAEVADEKERNSDLQERVIKEMEDNLKESKKNLEEIRIQADKEVKKTADVSAAEKSEKERRIKSLENEIAKQSDFLEELKSNLEKEQNNVFELSERLEIERSHSAMKENTIEDLTKKLRKEIDRGDEFRKLIEEAEDRTLRISEALTKEQVHGVEREECIKKLQDRIKDEQIRLSDAKEALEEELQLTNQLKEKLSLEQLLKSEFERELEKIKAFLLEERKDKENLVEKINRDKNRICETENQLREQEEDAKQKDAIIEELKSDLDTERKCYKILTERLHAEQNRIVELEIKLNETESVMNNDKNMLESLRENCLQGEERHFEILEKLERAEKLNKEKEEELSAFINELATEKLRVEELAANLDNERCLKLQVEERVKELEETTSKDEVLFEELRRRLDTEVLKHRETSELCDQERLLSQAFQKKVQDLERQVAQDNEIFEELKRNVDREREQSRQLDELLQQERSETVRRDNVLKELEGQLYIERITKDEIKGQLESERQSSFDLQEQLRQNREEEFNRKDVERKLAEEMKIEMEEKVEIQAQRAQELECMLEAERFKVLEKDGEKNEFQRKLEQNDLWLSRMADELAKDLEDSQSSTDEDVRGYEENESVGRRHENDRENQPTYDDLFSKILAGRIAKKNVKLKSKERKRRLAERETMLEDINRKFEDEKRMKEDRLAELEENENKLRMFENECEIHRRESTRLQDDLNSERNRSQYFERLLAEQQKQNQDQDEIVKSLEIKVIEGSNRLHATTEQYEKQLQESRARQEENRKMRDLCKVQQDKIEQLDKELEDMRSFYLEKENLSQETMEGIKTLKKNLDEAEHNILYNEDLLKREKGEDATDGKMSLVGSKALIGSLREEVTNVKRIIDNKLAELSSLRKRLSGRGDDGETALLTKMEERAQKAEAQLKKLQASYQLLLTDVDVKKFLVEEIQREANDLKNTLNEKDKIIIELRRVEKSKKPQEVCSDSQEIQNLRATVTQKEKQIQDLTNEMQKMIVALGEQMKQIQVLEKEYLAKLSDKDKDRRCLEVSVEIMKSVNDGLKAEKEREDAVKNAEKRRKGKKYIETATEMVADLREQIESLKADIADHQKMAQNLKEDDKRAKLLKENEKNYVKRRGSLRGVVALQIDEKQKKMRRLKMLLSSIENRHGKDMLALTEGGMTRDSSRDGLAEEAIIRTEDASLQRTLPLPDLVGSSEKCAFVEDKELRLGHSLDTNPSCVDSNVLFNKDLDEKSTNSCSIKRNLFAFFLVAVAIGFLTIGFKSRGFGSVLASSVAAIVLLLFAYRLKRNATGKTTPTKEYPETELLEKITQMKIRQEGDAKLIEELRRQLEEEISDKEVKRVELEELMASKDALFNSDKQRDSEEFEAKLKQEIEKTKLSEAEKRKSGLEEYKVLQEKIDYMKQLRETDMNERQAKIAELEKLAVISEERREHGIKAMNIPISAIPVCVAMSVFLCQLSGYHFTAPYALFSLLIITAVNASFSKKKVAQMLRDERQTFEEQNEEIDEMTDLLDRQFEVVKTQKAAIDMLVKEIEKEKEERKEKRNTLAKLIWQLQEMEGMQNIISKQTPRGTELESAVRIKAEEKALERARFYNRMVSTLKEVNAEDEDDDDMTDDVCNAVQELADYAEDQLEEQKKKELEGEKTPHLATKSPVSWKAVALVIVSTCALAASLVLRSYLISALIIIQTVIYGFQRREGSVDHFREKLRRESIRNKSLQLETEKLKKLLETENTYKMTDEYAQEIKERKTRRKSRKIF